MARPEHRGALASGAFSALGSVAMTRSTHLSVVTVVSLLACALVVTAPGEASAKDLRKRIGIGFNNNFSTLTSVSVKVGMPTNRETINLQVQALVGFSIFAKSDDLFFAGGRVLLPILAEDNLNLYGAVGGGYVRSHDASNGARVQAVLGVEFFLFGIENLGLSAEFGVNLDIIGGAVDIETTSGTAASVGVHYYF